MAGKLPVWFKKRVPDSTVIAAMGTLFNQLSLHTICESAICPNIGDCFSHRTATFLILGDKCTRNCTFCAVNKGEPLPLDPMEPEHITQAVKTLGLRYVVITSVTRDDISDGGASQFALIIRELREAIPGLKIETLVPDFRGSYGDIQTVVTACPDVIGHNIETVPRLYPEVRPMANFARSLGLLKNVKAIAPSIITKSGFMVGLGESKEEVIDTMLALHETGCDLLTIGQYLRPSSKHHPVVRFLHPDEFNEFADIGKTMGFSGIAASPLVRSSFNAADLHQQVTDSFPLMQK